MRTEPSFVILGASYYLTQLLRHRHIFLALFVLAVISPLCSVRLTFASAALAPPRPPSALYSTRSRILSAKSKPATAHRRERQPLGHGAYRAVASDASIATMATMVAGSGTIGGDVDAASAVHQYNSPFLPSSEPTDGCAKAALVLLNTPITPHGFLPSSCSRSGGGELSGVLGALWETSSYRVCADGAANRLYDVTVVGADAMSSSSTGGEEGEANANRYLPDLITGDLDSLSPNVRRYYEDRGVPVVRVEDQDRHDLDKALAAVERWLMASSVPAAFSSSSADPPQPPAPSRVFIYGAFGGRFDQEMGCINALYRWGPSFGHRLAMYGEETCAFVLPGSPVSNEIRIRFPDGRDAASKDSMHHGIQISGGDGTGTTNGQHRRITAIPDVGEGPTCGLVPVGARCDDVRTTGLKWNLDGNISLEFGGLVSSSNRVVDKVVTIRSSQAIVFTTEIIKKRW